MRSSKVGVSLVRKLFASFFSRLCRLRVSFSREIFIHELFAERAGESGGTPCCFWTVALAPLRRTCALSSVKSASERGQASVEIKTEEEESGSRLATIARPTELHSTREEIVSPLLVFNALPFCSWLFLPFYVLPLILSWLLHFPPHLPGAHWRDTPMKDLVHRKRRSSSRILAQTVIVHVSIFFLT